MQTPSYVIQALNQMGKERMTKPFHFVSLSVPLLGITPAQINVTGGLVLIPKVAYMDQLIVDGFMLRVNSAGVGAVTTLRIRTTDATPVDIVSFAVAQLTSGAILRPGDTGVTLGAGFCTKLNPGVGLVLIGLDNAGTPAQISATGSFTLDLLPLRLSAR